MVPEGYSTPNQDKVLLAQGSPWRPKPSPSASTLIIQKYETMKQTTSLSASPSCLSDSIMRAPHDEDEAKTPQPKI